MRCQATYDGNSWFRGPYTLQCEKQSGHEGQHQRTMNDHGGSDSWTRWDGPDPMAMHDIPDDGRRDDPWDALPDDLAAEVLRVLGRTPPSGCNRQVPCPDWCRLPDGKHSHWEYP